MLVPNQVCFWVSIVPRTPTFILLWSPRESATETQLHRVPLFHKVWNQNSGPVMRPLCSIIEYHHLLLLHREKCIQFSLQLRDLYFIKSILSSIQSASNSLLHGVHWVGNTYATMNGNVQFLIEMVRWFFVWFKFLLLLTLLDVSTHNSSLLSPIPVVFL